jgi:SpoVK/Ycf46/Vps4 family AAA+-type ATPase
VKSTPKVLTKMHWDAAGKARKKGPKKPAAGSYRIALLCGAPGLGKTTVAHVVLLCNA